MGLINSTTGEKKSKEIAVLKAQLQEQSACIQLLKSEVCVLRNMQKENVNDKIILTDIDDAKNNRDYEYLVFSGGGIKGISFAGVVEELHKLNIIYSQSNEFKLKGIAGTSAGSMISALLAVGYTPSELIDVMSNIDYEKLVDDKLGYIRDTYNFLEDWGVCPGDYAQELLGDLINKKTGNPDYTIEQLYNDKKIKLVIVTTDTNYSKSIYMYPGNPIKEYSNIPIRLAVRLSIGIPFVFEPYHYNDSYFVDGGVLDNYPLHVFDGEYPGDPKARLNLCPPNPKVLGIKLMTNDQQVNYEITQKQTFDSLFDYSVSFIHTFLTENDRRIMTPLFWKRSIIIITPDYPITKFDITAEEKNQMINIGKKYTLDFFTNA